MRPLRWLDSSLAARWKLSRWKATAEHAHTLCQTADGLALSAGLRRKTPLRPGATFRMQRVEVHEAPGPGNAAACEAASRREIRLTTSQHDRCIQHRADIRYLIAIEREPLRADIVPGAVLPDYELYGPHRETTEAFRAAGTASDGSGLEPRRFLSQGPAPGGGPRPTASRVGGVLLPVGHDQH